MAMGLYLLLFLIDGRYHNVYFLIRRSVQDSYGFQFRVIYCVLGCSVGLVSIVPSGRICCGCVCYCGCNKLIFSINWLFDLFFCVLNYGFLYFA